MRDDGRNNTVLSSKFNLRSIPTVIARAITIRRMAKREMRRHSRKERALMHPRNEYFSSSSPYTRQRDLYHTSPPSCRARAPLQAAGTSRIRVPSAATGGALP